MSAASDTEGLVALAAVGVGVYLLYKLFQGGSAVVTAAGAAAQTAGSAVADLFPTNIAAPGGSFTVTQANGTQVTVPAGWKSGDPIPYDDSQAADFSNAGNF